MIGYSQSIRGGYLFLPHAVDLFEQFQVPKAPYSQQCQDLVEQAYTHMNTMCTHMGAKWQRARVRVGVGFGFRIRVRDIRQHENMGGMCVAS